ncbi:MAG: hypothetical protein HY817_02730 [Candidatus Abawacabacteria bacterium]|nr:hypothetical protein [Candidatus Abawacabacteria bacterium]
MDKSQITEHFRAGIYTPIETALHNEIATLEATSLANNRRNRWALAAVIAAAFVPIGGLGLAHQALSKKNAALARIATHILAQELALEEARMRQWQMRVTRYNLHLRLPGATSAHPLPVACRLSLNDQENALDTMRVVRHGRGYFAGVHARIRQLQVSHPTCIALTDKIRKIETAATANVSAIDTCLQQLETARTEEARQTLRRASLLQTDPLRLAAEAVENTNRSLCNNPDIRRECTGRLHGLICYAFAPGTRDRRSCELVKPICISCGLR